MENETNGPGEYGRAIGQGRKLLDRVRDATRRLHYSIRTEDAYVLWIKQFILFHGKRHPRDLGQEEIIAFLDHLAVERSVAASTQNQALAALLFLYKMVLEAPLEGVGDAMVGQAARAAAGRAHARRGSRGPLAA